MIVLPPKNYRQGSGLQISFLWLRITLNVDRRVGEDSHSTQFANPKMKFEDLTPAHSRYGTRTSRLTLFTRPLFRSLPVVRRVRT